MTQNKNVFFFLLFISMVSWGASWVNAKILGEYVSPYELIFVRYALTIISMIPLIIYLKKSFKIDFQTLFLAFVAALLMIGYNKYFILGTKLGTASLGGAFVTTLIPINTFLILVIFFKREVLKKDVLALGIGAIGVMTILGVWHLDSEHIFTRYNLYFIFASLFWPILTIVSSFSKKISPIVFSFYIYVFTMFINFFFFDVTSMDTSAWDGKFWLNITFLAFGATTFATSIYFLGIERLGSKEVSSFIFLVPFAAILLSVWLLNEPFNAWMIVGTAMTILAVAILNNLITFKKRGKKVKY